MAKVLINLKPLLRYRDFRLLFLGQLISYLGSMITYVAMPYQVYQLTQSSAIVGMLGVVQLVPLLAFGILGGSVADSMDRRKLLIVSEGVLSVCSIALALNAWATVPSVVLIFVLTAIMQAVNGFHRPAMDALVQRLVEREDFGSVGALGSLRSGLGAVAGPALGGLLIATFGVATAYLVDFVSFLVALVLLAKMSAPNLSGTSPEVSWARIVEGFRYAIRRPELVGTYIVDIVAMTFAFPTALFPEMAQRWGGASAAGALFSGMSIGSLVITLLSGWTSRVRRHGAAVVLAAAAWGAAVIAFGLASSLPVALFFLGVAGAADMVSGLFRSMIWNETIPNDLRGRLAGIEMISYMTGPLLGNARAGWVAAASSTQVSIVSGGILCVAGVVACGVLLPVFWRYRPAE